jgi:hypothetical protein
LFIALSIALSLTQDYTTGDYIEEATRTVDFGSVSVITSTIKIKFKSSKDSNKVFYHVVASEYANKLTSIEVLNTSTLKVLKVTRVHTIPV